LFVDQSRSKNNGNKVVFGLFTPDSNPFGIPYREWTVRWWRWFLSQPKSTEPVGGRKISDNNTTANYQIYPEVWFLTGTTGGFAEKECDIPRGSALLCPIINFEISTAEDPNLKTDNDLVLYAKSDVDKIAKLNVEIDGFDLPDSKKFRVESGPFDVILPDDNICGIKAGPTRAAADGYWFFLKPMTAGKHQIQFSGSCLAGTINIGSMYYLTIK